jgi:hypothetical protein
VTEQDPAPRQGDDTEGHAHFWDPKEDETESENRQGPSPGEDDTEGHMERPPAGADDIEGRHRP